MNQINHSCIAKVVDKNQKLNKFIDLYFRWIDIKRFVLLPVEYHPQWSPYAYQQCSLISRRFPRFSGERITPNCIDLLILSINVRTNYKFCMLTQKAKQHIEPLYLNEMLENLRSSHDTQKLLDYRISTTGFTDRGFK